jgi:integrase
MTAAFRSARANQFVALLRPDSSTTGEHPRRPGCAETEWHRSSPRIIARPANDGGVAVGGQRDRHALACVSHSASSDELLALLRPDTTAAGEHPCRPSPAVVGPPAHNGGVTVHGQRNRHALACIVAGYFRSAAFANLSQSSQRLYRIALKPVLEAHGHRLVRELPKAAARNVIEAVGVAHPGMANVTRAVLSKVMAYAVATGVRTDNPFAGLERYRLGTHHTWTDAEIAQFERRWPLGTRERLAFALLLYTGQRGGDVVKMVRNDIVDGRLRVSQDKTRKGTTNELMIPIHPALARALKAGPVVGMQHIITDARGRPYRRLTALIERAAKLAGLPHHCVAHGLRKAALRRLAEHGSTTKEIAAMSGHRSLSEIERYTARADQARLAQSAVAKLPDDDENKG